MSTTTVADVVSHLFPQPRVGSPYLVWSTTSRQRASPVLPYLVLPLLPFDVFAATAHLLELSGAYHHIKPQTSRATRPLSGAASLAAEPRMLQISDAEIARARRLAEVWRKPIVSNSTREIASRYRELSDVAAAWRDLIETHGGELIFRKLNPGDPAPTWWSVTHFLFMVADEACRNVGFQRVDLPDGNAEGALWFERLAYAALSDDDGLPELNTLSSAAADVVCVLPKARTSAVGCTLRSLSHHLALLPPRGIARGRWHTPRPSVGMPDSAELNFLLIPFPYVIDDRAFEPASMGVGVGKNWGFFNVKQTWLKLADDEKTFEEFVDRLAEFVIELVKCARTDHGAADIDAVVLPELALSHRVYEALRLRLHDRLPNLEMLISGLSTHKDERSGHISHGNFAAVTLLSPPPRLENQADLFDYLFGPDDQLTTVREKHHRWKLDSSQIRNYGLEGGLNPDLDWWENIDLLSRRVDFTAFRQRSVLAVMLCEDLARIDPCQELLRSVGPSIVIALLMDAPQLKTRWPARYATVLAEDPGCSVLSFTSRALMARQDHLRTHSSKDANDRIIALWRDSSGADAREIPCPWIIRLCG